MHKKRQRERERERERALTSCIHRALTICKLQHINQYFF